MRLAFCLPLHLHYNSGNSAPWGTTMKFSLPFCCLIAALLLAIPLASQNVNMEHPQEINVQHRPSAEEIRDRLSASQVQKDAKELADLCAMITTDMDSVKQGMLPKDATEHLKRMEKVSKRMHENLTKALTER